VAGGHIPMAGGFDSMNLTAIVAGIVSLAMARRYRMAPSIGLLAMGFCILVAMMSGSNPPVTNLMPVLSSPLLTLHVTVIMISYALFFFIALNGLAALIVHRRAAEMRRVSLLMLYPATALLAIGIVIGALWANISWGNYWSWDPKEVWALITLIIYLFPLVNQNNNDRPAHFHLYCLFAFLSVIITYFGVNFILGGIHAYN
ncbi:MAG: cytochrome c biogenesis protein CcsA, partial [Bacteroidales bacterium]|nr:cytochrome c biogenesis protein CcsA [Bacteroidales bacterium]